MMDDTNRLTRSTVISAVLVGSLAALVIAAGWSTGAKQSQRRSTSEPIRPVTAPQTTIPSGGPPGWATGTVVSVSNDYLTIRTEAEALERIETPIGTQVCRAPAGCDATLQQLRPGDSIESALIDTGTNGERLVEPYRWVYANSIADYAVVLAVDGQRLTVKSTRHPELNLPPYTDPYVVIVEPNTIVNTEGAQIVGQYPGVTVGSRFYFTGSWASDAYVSPASAINIFPEQ